MKSNTYILVAMCVFSIGTTRAMNLIMPTDTLIRPEYIHGTKFQFDFFGETGISDAMGYNADNNTVNPLRIWSCDQNALTMLDGFPESSIQGQLRKALPVDDGVRGHFLVNGDLTMSFGGAFGAHYFFLPNTMLTVYLPVYAQQLKNVAWYNQTQNLTAADATVKELLTNEFFENVARLGNGLDLQGWKRSGFGDASVLVEWFKDHPQGYRPMLKNIRLNGRFGFSLPTGLKRGEDIIFAYPFGNDGALGLIAGGGLDALLGHQFKLGFDVQLMHAFSVINERRVKTSVNQTDLLLLEKTCIQTDFGLMQRFNLYVQGYHLAHTGLSLRAGYQFYKHGENTVTIVNNSFSSGIANVDPALEEWMMHLGEFELTYDFGVHLNPDSIKPSLSLFARIPFNGTRVALVRTAGAVFSLMF